MIGYRVVTSATPDDARVVLLPTTFARACQWASVLARATGVDMVVERVEEEL